ncbi:MAG: nuclear transport factor 2 family protein [Leucobacter sp.]
MAFETEHDVILRLYTSYNARSLQGWLDSFADEAVWTNVPTGDSYTGADGHEENYHLWNTPFPNGKCEDIVIRAGDGFAVAEFNGVGTHEGPLATENGVVEATGIHTSFPFCDVHTIENGKITSTHRYWDQAGADAQLGL